MKNEEYLIYVSIEEPNKNRKDVFRFYFSKDIKKAEGDGWYEPIAYGNADVPYNEHISSELLLITDKISFDCPQYNETLYFSYLDACEGVISICWEDIHSYQFETYNNNKYERLVFPYGETKTAVIRKLKERNENLDNNMTII